MADIIDFETKRRNKERQHRAAFGSEKAAKGNLDPDEKIELEYEGGLIWRQLKKHPGKLKLKDRIQIARNLHDMKKIHRIKTGDLIKEADLGPEGSKELYRLTLPPGGDAKKHGLRAHKTKYMRLIEGIHRLTGVPRSIIAEDACRYTSLHSDGAKDLSREEKVFFALQSWAARINKEHGLLEHYRATAEARITLLKQGGNLRWPTFPKIDRQFDDLVEADYDPKYAFWAGDRLKESSKLCWHEFVPYVPHVFLGFIDSSYLESFYDASHYFPGGNPGQCILESVDGGPKIAWDTDTSQPRFLVNGDTWQAFERQLWETRDAHFADAWRSMESEGKTIKELLDKVQELAGDLLSRERENIKLVAAHMRKTGQAFDPSPYIALCWHGDFDGSDDYYNCFDKHIPPMMWLTLYPDQNCQNIVPVIVEMPVDDPQYIAWREVSSPRDLESPLEFPFLNNEDSEHQASFLEQVMKLLADDTIPEEWERTVSFVQCNPILQEKARQDVLENGVSASLEAAIHCPVGEKKNTKTRIID